MEQNKQEITTGIDKLDSLLIGLKQNSIILLGGKPENNVTNFSLNLLANLCIRGKKCLFCSFGLWRQELLRRLITRELHNDFMEIEKSNFKSYLSSITKVLENIFQWNLETFELLGGEHSLELKIKEFKPDYIFIDCYEDLEQLISFDNDVVNFVQEIAKKYNRIPCEINAVSDEEFEDDFGDDDFENEEYEDTDDFLGDITIYFEINNFSRRKSNGHINNK